MTYLPHMLKRKPLYAALASATLSFAGYIGVPATAFAQTSAPAASAAPAQTSDSTTVKKDEKDKKAGKEKKGDLTNMEAVVVTSYRQSIDQNVLDKRDANSIVEVINAQNIAQFPAKNIAELVTWLKANPSKANYPTPSPVFTLPIEHFKIKTGAPATAISYRSSNESVTSLLSGQTAFGFVDFIQADANRPLCLPGMD